MSADDLKGELRTGTSLEEDVQIGNTPATYVNKVYLTANPQGAKITFAEMFQVGGEPKVQPRAAVYLLPQDLISLYRLLDPLVKSAAVADSGESKAETETDG